MRWTICIIIMMAGALGGRCLAQATRPANAAPSLSPEAYSSITTVPGTQDPREVMDAAHRLPHIAPMPGETLDIEIKALGNFMYDSAKGGNIPPDVMALNGATIRTRGFIVPLDDADNLTNFAFVPSLFGCCFGQPPQVQHTIVVRTAPGKTVARYTPEEVVVEGKLHVIERKDDGFIISIFEMDASSIHPAPK